MKKIFNFDVPLKALEGFKENKSNKVKFILDFLKSFWFDHNGGSSLEYWDRVRVGSVEVYLDDENHLHLDFITRFSLGNYPELIEVLEKLKK